MGRRWRRTKYIVGWRGRRQVDGDESGGRCRKTDVRRTYRGGGRAGPNGSCRGKKTVKHHHVNGAVELCTCSLSVIS